MNDPFSAEEFVEKLALGGFSGQVRDQIQKLSRGQLERVERLMLERLRNKLNVQDPDQSN